VATNGLSGLLPSLRQRGLVAEVTPGLDRRLATGRTIAGYVGFDPSFPSLHAGNLVPVMGLLRLQQAGGRPIVVLGGGTGMIGDPSGKSEERNLLDDDTLAGNTEAIRSQLERFIDFAETPTGALLADNREWLSRYGILDFLRKVGKHFTVSYMLDKESVQARLAGGLSFTEFSYMLLQAADFRHLYRHLGVELQMGGADQWGNITAGLELIRRSEGPTEDGERAFGLAFPLLTDARGQKFGKTQGQSVYLGAEFTTPYAFYQYWINTDDRDVATRLRALTLVSDEQIESLEAEQAAHPEQRPGQRALAAWLTERVHGADAARRQAELSDAVFGGELTSLPPDRLAELHAELEPWEWADGRRPETALDLAVTSGAYASRGEARRGIEQGGLTINDRRVGDPAEAPPAPIAGEFYIVRVGKKRTLIGRRARAGATA
jgi:tyrosyl-tRNA synthetase